MADFLTGMALASRRRCAWRARRVPLPEMRARAADAPPAPPLALSSEGFDLLAEVKRRAPGAGQPAREEAGLPARFALDAATGGAAAVSVLTEPLAFAGSLADLREASRAAREAPRPIPTMRKDFVVDPYQVYEARAEGAGGVLLIAGLVSAGRGIDLVDAAADAGVWVLVETFTDDHLGEAACLARRAVALGVTALLGVNVRDLRTLEVERDRLARLAPRVHAEAPDLPAVAESGIRDGADTARAAELGYRLALVGRALALDPEPSALVARLIVAGRRAARAETVG